VQVELVEADIDNPPIYEALSYAWDSPQLDSFVVCNNCAIPVTINCQKALKRLRKYGSGNLFVDAICINQSSTNEKNHQVAAMGDVYANAQKVICWIGDE
ncbi:heterokaryon incompatibility, partial [Hyaloscypha variabilis F]